VRQVVGEDSSGRGVAAQSRRSFELTPRTAGADKVVKSICPYCAVGCGQDVYVKDGKVIRSRGTHTHTAPDADADTADRALEDEPASFTAAHQACLDAQLPGQLDLTDALNGVRDPEQETA